MVLAIAKLVVYLVVTRPAKAHQIRLGVRTATCQGKFMMHLLDGCHDTFSQTPLAERMASHVLCPSSEPLPVVFLFNRRLSRVLVVVLSHDFSMFLAVPSVRQLRASGVGTRL